MQKNLILIFQKSNSQPHFLETLFIFKEIIFKDNKWKMDRKHKTPEYILRSVKRYRAKNKIERINKKLKYLTTDGERKSSKTYYEKNKDKINERNRDRYNRECALKYMHKLFE